MQVHGEYIQEKGSGDSIQNPIIIQSLFRETTRNGKHTIRLVLLALTRNLLMIASSHSFGTPSAKSIRNGQNILEIRSLHPLESLKLTIFKKSERHTLKLCFHNKYHRYFELDKSFGTDEIWAIWCMKVLQLEESQNIRKRSSKKSLDKSTSYNVSTVEKQVVRRISRFSLQPLGSSNYIYRDMEIIECRRIPGLTTGLFPILPREYHKVYIQSNKEPKKQQQHLLFRKWQSHKVIWNNKHLYLGSKREEEDSSRPIPVQGLGPPEDIKLLYLKPQYFGCWDQTEHWVQCESSKLLKY